MGLAAVASAALTLAAVANDVPTAVTAEDEEYLGRMLRDAGSPVPSAPADELEGQVREVRAMQDAVLRASPVEREIPTGHPREPRDLYERGHGICYDRSRSIEKGLAFLGYRTRHASVYSTHRRSAVGAMLKPGGSSHSLTEVLTATGWMIVDSNHPWVGLTSDRRPVGLADLQELGPEDISWAPEMGPPRAHVFKHTFTYAYGVYSRHGGFYAPYAPIPDVSWRELVANLTE